jgi:hypothetical protein
MSDDRTPEVCPMHGDAGCPPECSWDHAPEPGPPHHAEPSGTMPPYVPGRSLEDQVADAIGWEYRKLLACGPRLTAAAQSRLFAKVAVAAVERDQRERAAGSGSAQ